MVQEREVLQKGKCLKKKKGQGEGVGFRDTIWKRYGKRTMGALCERFYNGATPTLGLVVQSVALTPLVSR